MALPTTKKDEMIIYIDSNPNNRIAAPVDTLFWRNVNTFYLIPAYSNALTRIDLPQMKDPKYNAPIYKNYKFMYANANETWIKTTDSTDKTGWQLLKYAAPTIGGLQTGSIPPTPPTPPITGSFTGSFSGSFAGSFTGSFIVYNATGDFTGNFYYITNSYYFSGSNYFIGEPTDGYYGSGSDGNAAGLLVGDSVEDALDKLDYVLDKLVPAKPPMLATKTLTITSTYSARQAGTNISIANITNNPNPTIELVGGMVVANGFSDGDVGILSASVDGTTTGVKVLSPADDTGIYGDLQITNDYDYYAGQTGKQDFWKALLAKINVGTPLSSIGPHTGRLTHTTTGQTPLYTFYKDDAVTPTAVVGSVTGSGVSYISGVPALVGGVNGASVQFTMSAANTIGRFYNASRIFAVGGTGLSTTNVALPNSPASGSSQSATQAVSVNGGSASEAPSFTVTAYNSAGGSAAVSIPSVIRMDSTLDSTNRVDSGIGQYPSVYGTPFVSTVSVATNEELQMLNGQYRYPTGNYTAALPVAGPDYSSVPVGSYSNYRWATFNMGTITNRLNLLFTFNNASNFSTGVMTNFCLYIRVDGANPTNGWVNGNLSYSGGPDPTNDEDGALIINYPNPPVANMKKITFGSSVKTGTVYVRVGIPVGNNKAFGSITMTPQ